MDLKRLHVCGLLLVVCLKVRMVSSSCFEPLGMQNGLIPGSAITSSTTFNFSTGPSNARLNQQKSKVKNQGGGWTAQIKNKHQWLQVDVGRLTNITQIATQGRADKDEWVTSYTLSFSRDGLNFTEYENENSKQLQGNMDRNSVQVHQLNPVIRARYIRIMPQAWSGKISMRTEVYGCRDGCFKSIGLEDRSIPDSSMTSSTALSDYSKAPRGRLNLPSGSTSLGSWKPNDKDQDQWLQVDFGAELNIIQIATQGTYQTDEYVTRYSLEYGQDGLNFTPYASGKVLQGNFDSDTIVINVLHQPIKARFVRVLPRDWKNWIALRVEFYICTNGTREMTPTTKSIATTTLSKINLDIKGEISTTIQSTTIRPNDTLIVQQDDPKRRLDVALLVGSAVTAAVLLSAAILAAIWCMHKRRKRRRSQSSRGIVEGSHEAKKNAGYCDNNDNNSDAGQLVEQNPLYSTSTQFTQDISEPSATPGCLQVIKKRDTKAAETANSSLLSDPANPKQQNKSSSKPDPDYEILEGPDPSAVYEIPATNSTNCNSMRDNVALSSPLYDMLIMTNQELAPKKVISPSYSALKRSSENDPHKHSIKVNPERK